MRGQKHLAIAALWSLLCQSAWGFAGGGCFLPGTPVMLADGREVPIEGITTGTK
ncbi:uncharacterized protein METZ01_LOCUS465635, partial [marine metagenome]